MSNTKLVIALAVVCVLAGGIWYSSQRSTNNAWANNGSSYQQKSADVPTTKDVSNGTQLTTSENNKNMPQVTIETTKGTIVLELYPNDAPKTVENFITLAKKGFYDGTIFHRVIEGFMVQGGDPTGTGGGGPGYTFADELNPNTASYKAGYTRGTLAMANAGPNTNGSQFFIMQQDMALPHNYTIFGHVVSGLDVVDAIAGADRDGSDKPLQDIVMKKVTVSEPIQ
jgi:cyclophilin family peptidyl-prolyl cis-trans isomerase